MQRSSSDLEYAAKKKLTRRGRFLAELVKFRCLLEANGLTRKIVDTTNGHLAEKGLTMREGTIVDATLIRGAALDQEQGRRTRPGNASIEKGQ